MIVLHFLALVSCYKINMINMWDIEFCWLQDLDKHTTVSAPENKVRDLRR